MSDTFPAVWQDAVQVGGLVYPVLRAGRIGPLVVCLHGFPDNYEGYRPIAQTLADAGYQVVCPMLPGYVPSNQRTSGQHDAKYVRDALIDLVEVLLLERGQKNCHLVGHDWGCVIACFMAQHKPQLFKSLCAMSVPYGMSWLKIALRYPKYMLHSWYIAFFQTGRFADWVITRNNMAFLNRLLRWWNPKHVEVSAMQRSVLATFRQPGVLKAALDYYRTSMFSFKPLGFEIRSLFNKTIEVPTLAIRGALDITMPQGVWDVVSAESFPRGITLEVMLNAGHFVQYEQPEVLSQRLLKWFAANADQ